MPDPRVVSRLTVDLTPEIARKLARLATERGVGKRVIIEQALLRYFQWLKEDGRGDNEPES